MIESTDCFYELLLDLCAVEEDTLQTPRESDEANVLEVTMEMAV
ncbi:hypothetical protein [Bacillus taeanensis]|nr:hypothetical protein [Bacillus taeanensis]